MYTKHPEECLAMPWFRPVVTDL